MDAIILVTVLGVVFLVVCWVDTRRSRKPQPKNCCNDVVEVCEVKETSPKKKRTTTKKKTTKKVKK
jgi:hypothetical protein